MPCPTDPLYEFSSDNTSPDTALSQFLCNTDVRNYRHSRAWMLHRTYARWGSHIPGWPLWIFSLTAVFPLLHSISTLCSDVRCTCGCFLPIQIRPFPHNRNGSTAPLSKAAVYMVSFPTFKQMDRKALIFCDLLHQFLQICTVCAFISVIELPRIPAYIKTKSAARLFLQRSIIIHHSQYRHSYQPFGFATMISNHPNFFLSLKMPDIHLLFLYPRSS